MFDIIELGQMSLRAVWEVKDWICKLLTLQNNLDQTSVQTKIPDQISSPVVGRGEMRVNQSETPAF